MQGSKASALSAGDWEDSLTNISVGDLLFDAPDDEETDCIDSALCGSSHFLSQMPLSCDSFDAAIAAHIYKHQSKADSQMALPPQASSIWNAEDTCDAFAFKKNVAFSDKSQCSSSNVGAENSQRIAQSSSLVLDAVIKVESHEKSLCASSIWSVFIIFYFFCRICLGTWSPLTVNLLMMTQWMSVNRMHRRWMVLQRILMGSLAYIG